MNDQEATVKHPQNEPQASEASMLKTVLWIGVGILAYIGIQWMLPKVGVSS
jgi:hypothetical protein